MITKQVVMSLAPIKSMSPNQDQVNNSNPFQSLYMKTKLSFKKEIESHYESEHTCNHESNQIDSIDSIDSCNTIPKTLYVENMHLQDRAAHPNRAEGHSWPNRVGHICWRDHKENYKRQTGRPRLHHGPNTTPPPSQTGEQLSQDVILGLSWLHPTWWLCRFSGLKFVCLFAYLFVYLWCILAYSQAISPRVLKTKHIAIQKLRIKITGGGGGGNEIGQIAAFYNYPFRFVYK